MCVGGGRYGSSAASCVGTLVFQCGFCSHLEAKQSTSRRIRRWVLGFDGAIRTVVEPESSVRLHTFPCLLRCAYNNVAKIAFGLQRWCYRQSAPRSLQRIGLVPINMFVVDLLPTRNLKCTLEEQSCHLSRPWSAQSTSSGQGRSTAEIQHFCKVCNATFL